MCALVEVRTSRDTNVKNFLELLLAQIRTRIGIYEASVQGASRLPIAVDKISVGATPRLQYASQAVAVVGLQAQGGVKLMSREREVEKRAGALDASQVTTDGIKAAPPPNSEHSHDKTRSVRASL